MEWIFYEFRTSSGYIGNGWFRADSTLPAHVLAALAAKDAKALGFSDVRAVKIHR